VELYQSIRNAVSKEGRSIRPTAKEFKVHRREVHRALASAMVALITLPQRAPAWWRFCTILE
jgi:hypothetical protein